MIVEHDRAAQAVGRAWELSPNRSLDLRGLLAFFAVMAAASLMVSGYSFSQGNAFAPAFALAELALLAVCLRLVWRRLARRERLALTGDFSMYESRPLQDFMRESNKGRHLYFCRDEQEALHKLGT